MKTERRWKVVALLAAGIAVGVVMVGTPAGAHVSGWTHNWNQHIKPKADKRYLPGGAITGGRTLRGTFSIDGTATAAGQQGSDSISFGWTLASAPVPHFIAAGTSPPADCPGTVANPKARKGHLCVYEADNTNVGARTVYDMTTYLGSKADKYGFGVYMYGAVAAGFYTSHGTWAVQTPSPSSATPRPAARLSDPAPGGGPGQ